MDRDLVLMNPLIATSANEKWIRELLFEPLLAMDQRGEIHPLLAQSWEVSPDGTTYSFHLRKGVRYHNGQEMTAEDARFALEYTLKPENGAYGRARLSGVERAEALDRHTLRVRLTRPSPSFLAQLTSIQAFAVLPKGSLPDGVQQPAAFPPGTGPFKFVEWQPKQRLVVDRNDDYWGRKALLDRVVLRPVEDSSVRFAALRAGDVDVAVRVPLPWARQLVNGEARGLTYTHAPRSGLHAVQFNVAHAPFDDKRLRQAVAHALDKREILDAAFYGFGEVTDQKYPPGHVWYFEGVHAPAHDVYRAGALLRQAGYAGETVDLIVDQQGASRTASTAIQAQLRRVGMDIRILTLDPGAYNDRARRGDYAFRFGGATFSADPATTYGPDLWCEPDGRGTTTNASHYCDAEMNALLQAAESELDPDRRRALYRQVVTRLNDDLPQVYVGFSPRFHAAREQVRGFTAGSEGQFQWHGGGLSHTWLTR
jgi:peptide/nickel transport system substrate-binding protein